MVHTLEVALPLLVLAVECDLGDTLAQKVPDSLVGDIAHLEIVVHDFTTLVADSAVFGWHQGVACVVIGADVAVDPGPAFVTVATLPIPHRAVLSSR